MILVQGTIPFPPEADIEPIMVLASNLTKFNESLGYGAKRCREPPVAASRCGEVSRGVDGVGGGDQGSRPVRRAPSTSPAWPPPRR
jgi:hypothetical protein